MTRPQLLNKRFQQAEPVDVALIWADAGYYVVPFRPDAQPWGFPWSEAATTDPAEIRRLFRGRPGSLVACVVKPSGVFALDLDRHHADADGVAAFDTLCDQHNAGAWPDAMVQHTPSDGYHLVFRAVPEIGNGRGSLPPGIDVRGGNGHGGIVFMAGSYRHGKAGRPDGFYTLRSPLVSVSELPPPPEWLVSIILAEPDGKTAARRSQPALIQAWQAKPEWWAVADANASLGKIRCAREGERNEVLNKQAWLIGHGVAAGVLDEDEARREIMLAARYCGLPEYEAERTLDSAFTGAGVGT